METFIVLAISAAIGLKHLSAGFFGGLFHAGALMAYTLAALGFAWADNEHFHDFGNRAPMLVAPIPNLWLWMGVGWLFSGAVAASRAERNGR